MKRLLILIFISFNLFSIAAQDLPESIYELNVAKFNDSLDALLRNIEEDLKSVKDGSLLKAYRSLQKSYLYRDLGNQDSSQYFFDQAEAYWSTQKIDESNSDYFGQFLLFRTLSPYSADLGAIAYLDSATSYLTNAKDKAYLETLKFRKVSAYNERDEYAKQLNDFLSDPKLSTAMRAEVLEWHTFNLLNMDEQDSAMRVLEELEPIVTSSTMLMAVGYRKFLIHFRKEDLSAARAQYYEIQRLMKLNRIPLQSNAGTQFISAASALFVETGQYDSAIYYTKENIEFARTRSKRNTMAIKYGVLADLSRKMNRFDEAIDYFQQSIALCDESNYHNKVKGRLNYLPSLFEAYEGTLDASRKEYLLSEMKEVVDALDVDQYTYFSPADLSRYNVEKAKYFILIDKNQVAEPLLKDVLTSALNEDRITQKFYAHYYLAQLYLAEGKIDNAIENATEALSYEQINYHDLLKVHELLIKSYAGKGMVEKVEELFLTYKNIQSESMESKTSLLLSETEAQQTLLNQVKLNELLANEKELDALLITRLRIIVGIALASALVIAFFMIRTRVLNKQNVNLLQELVSEREELQDTNLELADVVSELKSDQEKNKELFDNFSSRTNRMLSIVKGLTSFIPELGKLNSEQSKYFNRMTDLVKEEEASLNALIALNSVLGDHKIEISRVSLADTIKSVGDKAQNILHLNQASLEVDIEESLVFLADRELIEMTIASLLQHSLSQDLKDKRLKLSVSANDGLQMVFEFEGGSVSSEVIDGWLSKTNTSHKGYVSKVVQLKDLMDGELQYFTIGDLHKITLNLNLIEVKPAENKVGEVDELEIDGVYDKVMGYLVKENGLSHTDLTLVSLSEALSITTRRISFVINTRERTNFSKFLARLRVEKVKEILDGGVHTHLNIAGIGYEAGFNSKSTFFSSFKEFVGCTPKEYMTESSGQQSA